MNLLKSLFPTSITFRPTASVRVPEPQATSLAIAKRTCHRVALAAGQRVECTVGAVWITRDGDIKDVVICAREPWVSDSDGMVIVTGLETAIVTIGQ